MGKPVRIYILSPIAEYIGYEERTQGSETSQYLKEETSNEIPLVAASERGTGQTVCTSV